MFLMKMKFKGYELNEAELVKQKEAEDFSASG
jgi:hypothetical protein